MNSKLVHFPSNISNLKRQRDYDRSEAHDAENYLVHDDTDPIDYDEPVNNDELDKEADANDFFEKTIAPLYQYDINDHKLERFFSLASLDYGILSQHHLLDTQRIRESKPVIENKGLLLTDVGLTFVHALSDDEFDALVDNLLQRTKFAIYIIQHIWDVLDAPDTTYDKHARLLFNTARTLYTRKE